MTNYSTSPTILGPPAPPGPPIVPIAKDIRDILIQGTKLDQHVIGACTDCTLTYSIDNAMTLDITLSDPDRIFLTSGIFGNRVKLQLDALMFELVRVSKNGDDLTATFEDAWVAEMRRRKSYRKAARGTVTRAGFLQMLTREIPGLNFFCPDPTQQKIAVPANAVKPLPEPLPVQQGANPPSNDQVSRHDPIILPTPRSPSNTDTVTVIASKFGGPDDPHTGNNGAYGYLPGHDAYAELSTNPEVGDVNKYNYSALGHLPPHAKLEITYKGRTVIAEKLDVGRGQDPPVARIDLWWETAAKLGFPNGLEPVQIRRLPDGTSTTAGNKVVSGASSPTSVTVEGSYEYSRGYPKKNYGIGVKEDTWTCADRLAKEVQWRRFMVGNTFWFADDKDLVSQAPKATINERSIGVVSIDFDWDAGKPVGEMQVEVETARWSLLPGAVVNVTDMGPASGKWLLANCVQSVFKRTAALTLTRPLPTLLEPPTPTRAASDGSTTVPFVGEAADPLHDFSYINLVNLCLQFQQSGRITWTHPNDAVALNHNGVCVRDDGTNIQISKFVWQFLAFMLKNNLWQSLIITSMLGTHSQLVAGSSRQSQHWTGQAIDIGTINNHLIHPGDADFQRDQMIVIGDQTKVHSELHISQIIGYTSLSGPVGGGSSAEYLALSDHQDHIHVGF